MDLFDFSNNLSASAPLAERMRPENLDEFAGQGHIIGQGSLLRRAVKADKLGSCIFYGPPGTGKTTLAHIISKTTDGAFVKLNAVSSGVADAKRVIDEAADRIRTLGKKTYLLLDECHRWNKAQSDCVLAAMESGTVIFIGSTTENPYASMTRAIVSRCRVFEFLPLTAADIEKRLYAAVIDKERGLGRTGAVLAPDAARHIAFTAAGDLRTALNALELAVLTTAPGADGKITVDKKTAEQSIQRKALSYDETMYYDMLSAFIKSMRGGDETAALYWAFRLLEGGCDPMLIARRVVIHASEDVGLADPSALPQAVAALTALQNIGLPEGRLPLTQAILYVSLAPKSNDVLTASDMAAEDANKVKDDNVPHYLRDRNFPRAIDDGSVYKYPHDYEGNRVEQQYLPDSLKGRSYYNGKNLGRKEK